MKKWLVMLILIGVVVISITSCVRQQEGWKPEKEPPAFQEPQYDWGKSRGETLVVWAKKPDGERTYMKKAFERYQELTGNHLRIVQMEKQDFEEKMRVAFHGTGEKPDIIMEYGGVNIQKFNPNENFYDFTDAVWVDDLTATSINQAIYDGKVIGLPHWEASISGMIYNKELFQKYEIEIPKTQNEFMAVCEQFHQQGITPVYLPGADASMLLYQFPMDVIVQESEQLEKLNSGRLRYADIPEMYTMLDWYRAMAQNGYFGASYQTDSWNDMSAAMNGGKYAMMFCWDTWLYTDFNGDPSKFGLMPAFVGLAENGMFEGPNLSLLIVNKKSPRVQAAVDFITFMADPYNYNAAFEDIRGASAFKNQVANISTPQYVAVDRLVERNYYESRAWLRIRGFSQMDATCILRYMAAEPGYTAKRCLMDMDELRTERMKQ